MGEALRRDLRVLLGAGAVDDIERVLHGLTLILALREPVTIERLARSWEDTTALAYRSARRVGAGRVLAALGTA